MEGNQGTTWSLFTWFGRAVTRLASLTHDLAESQFRLALLKNRNTIYNNPTMADPASSLPAALATDAPLDTSGSKSKQTVDPWNVAGEIGADGIAKAINYLTLIDEFGTKKILEEDLERFKKVTGHKPHRFMRRGIVFSHRDLNLILDRHEKGEPFFLYTGRGPSSDSMHIGHTIPFEFTK